MPILDPAALQPNLPLERTRPTRPAEPSPSSDAPDTPSFGEALESVVQETNEAIANAEQASADFADGRTNDIHGTMISLQEADVRLRMLGSVRNRALEAYREIMRMGS